MTISNNQVPAGMADPFANASSNISPLHQGNIDSKVVSLNLDPSKCIGQINENIYGHFLEHLFHSVNGGLWGELIWNRSFERIYRDGAPEKIEDPTLPNIAQEWESFGNGLFELTRQNPLNGELCQLIKIRGCCGILQRNIAVYNNEVYSGSLWLRGDFKGIVNLSLGNGQDAVTQVQFDVKSSDNWNQYDFSMQASGSISNGILKICFEGDGNIYIDQVSMTSSSAKNNKGFRSDLVEAIKQLSPPLLRWPGGAFVHHYRWKDAIGPQHKRKHIKHYVNLWDHNEVNSCGIDEFMSLCSLVNTKPLIVINSGMWTQDFTPEDALKETIDLIEYCNGAVDSYWGRIRAQNGHPEPYNVEMWEIDNETYFAGEPEKYCKIIKTFAPAMRAKDPSIKITVCGSGDYNFEWSKYVIENCAKHFDYLAVHHYEEPDNFAKGVSEYEDFLRKIYEVIQKSENPSIKLNCSEWNAQTIDWRTGLYAGGILNAFERMSDFMYAAAPAVFVRHVDTKPGYWDNAFINFNHTGWFPGANYVVMKLWRENFQPLKIAVSGNVSPLDIMATKSADEKKIVLKCVNPSGADMELDIKIEEPFIISKAGMKLIAPGSLFASNNLKRPQHIRAEEGKISINCRNIHSFLPAYSVCVINLK